MSFTSDLTKFCKEEAPQYVDSTVRKAVIEIGNRLVYRSPVGNPELWLVLLNGEYKDYLAYKDAPEGYVGGKFRANWQYGFGAVPSGEIDAVDKTGAVTAAKIRTSVMAGNAVGVHYIANNLPYAQRLEDGWSSQTPNGMVGLTELEFPEIFRRASL